MNDTLRSVEKRRLATWIFTDVVGFSALAESNETLAQELIVEHRAIVRRVLIKRNGVEHHGIPYDFSRAAFRGSHIRR